MRGRCAGLSLAVAGLLAVGGSVPSAQAAQASKDVAIPTSDGVSLAATVSGEAPLEARPVVVEFSPYGRGSATLDPGPKYNFLLVEIRGTGGSGGRFDALGPRTQRDVAEVLEWACEQRWSDGNLALNGFSASAITIYNSLHLELPCVKAAILKSGTFELYRDLIWPGGINNLLPAAVVMAAIGAPALAQGPERLFEDPLSSPGVLAGLMQAGLAGLAHETLDSWWRRRGFRGDVNDLPILMIGGFFDVESRGAFQAFQRLRDDGAHLIVIGAHDGAPAGTDGGLSEARAWLGHHVLGLANGVERHPAVQLWLADGDREGLAAGSFVRVNGERWPIPGTRWASLALDPTRSGTAGSPNDGSLTLGEPVPTAVQAYPALPSLPPADLPNIATAGAAGFNSLSTAFPFLTDMSLVESTGLSYTTEPLAHDVLSAGPASLELRLSSSAPETGIWAVISDVAPDGSAHPVASGRLLSTFPKINRKRSLRDPKTGRIVQPYGAYGAKSEVRPGERRRYRLEFWPIGNRFKAGHRLRLHIVGTSALSLPGLPALNRVHLGGRRGSRLLLPVLGGGLGGALA